jgi:hypothetical protein
LSDKTGFPQALASLETGARRPEVAAPTAALPAPSNLPPARGLTADGNSVTLVERDWTGLVLVPVMAEVDKAYSSSIRLMAIEAHPLKTGGVRVWMRVGNRTRADLKIEVACTFRMRGATEEPSTRFYQLLVTGDQVSDVFFVSPPGELLKYKVFVKPPTPQQ